MSTAWARSGGMWLTGREDGEPLEVDGDPAGAVAAALRDLPGSGLPGVSLLGERAALRGLRRRGTTTAGGAGRLLRASDGWVAVSLARSSDVELLPALVEGTVNEPWTDLATWVERHTAADLADRAALLGLAAAAVPPGPAPPRRPGTLATPGGGTTARRGRPRVLDLSSLWAGPLCAHLLGLLGADVVKVESTRRPDGARSGHPEFFALLHHEHRSVALDFTHCDADREALRRLVSGCDLVIEGSRPRALRQLGIDAEDAVAAGTSWLAVSAYGRGAGDESRVGFGDDVAAGAGLTGRDADGPVFAGDALADPLTGVVAARAAHAALAEPTAQLLDVSMHDVARDAAGLPAGTTTEPARPPRARVATAQAAALGTHTRAVLAEWS